MDLSFKVLPIEDMRQPCEGIEEVKHDCSYLPVPAEGIDEEKVPRKRNHGIIHDIWILKVNSAVFYIIARVD